MFTIASRTAKAALAVTAALGIGIGFAGSASASTVVWDTATTPGGLGYGAYCSVQLLIAHNYNNSGHDYAAARIFGGTDGAKCGGILLSSADGGKTYNPISGYHIVGGGAGNYVTTYYYYDGPGHKAYASTCLLGSNESCLIGASTVAY